MSIDPVRNAKPTWQTCLTAFAFTLAAGLIRLLFLERQALWNDEMFSFDVANLPLMEIQSRLVAYYHHPPLFFYALHASLSLFGQSAWALRIIPAIAGSVSVGLVYLVAERFYGRRSGIVAAAICLVAPFHVAYSQEGRPYALAACFCLLSLYAMLMSIREGGRLWKLTYVAATSALLYTHHWGVFVVFSQMVFLLTDRSVTPGVKKAFLVLWSAVGICYLPELFALLNQSPVTGTTASDWVVAPGPMELVDLAGAFSGVSFRMASAVFTMPWPVTAAAGLACFVLVVHLVRKAFTSPGDGTLRAMLLVVGVTIIVPYALSFWVPKLFLWYRYPVILLPVLCVCVGAATDRSWLPAIPALVLIVAGVAGTAHYFTWSKSNVRDVASYVEEATKDSVRMVIRPHNFAFLLNYYYHGKAVQLDETYLDKPLGEIVDTAASFVYVSLDVPNGIRDYMDWHFDKIAERRFPGEAHLGMVVGVYKQKPDLDEEDDPENDEEK